MEHGHSLNNLFVLTKSWNKITTYWVLKINLEGSVACDGEHNNTLFSFSSCIGTTSFTSSLGHCTSCIALYDNSYQPIQYQNIQEIHCLTSNTSITCISIIYSWAGLFQYFLFCHILLQFYFQYSFPLRKNQSTSNNASWTSTFSLAC